MNFFEHQDAARRRTSLLIFYFILAVISIIAVVYLAVAALFVYGRSSANPGAGPAGLWDPNLFVGVALATLAVISLGSLYKIAVLGAGGGKEVALQLGGRLLLPNTRDLNERKLLNVVEEMALASGTPVPPVYLLDREAGINAFAAGFTPQDAVIGVTRGCIVVLTRDELQGVLAHEFSHILNGDMRLDIRLMGVLHGILLIGIIGYWLLRSAAYSGGFESRDDREGRRGQGQGAAILLLGLALVVIGYVGLFFGRLIKASVSRQREFLADASAVQFTRNPDGIAGALKKIGGLAAGSVVRSPAAEEASHLFFSDAATMRLFDLLATHPPLDERIRRIDPQFDGVFPKVELPDVGIEEESDDQSFESAATKAQVASTYAPSAQQRVDGFERLPFHPPAAMASIGAPGLEHLNYAAALVSALPETLVERIHEPLGAVAAIYDLLLSKNPEVRNAQLSGLRSQAPQEVLREIQSLAPLVAQVRPEARLPLVQAALPALVHLSRPQFENLCEMMKGLIQADREVSVFEYALHRLTLGYLSAHFQPPRQAAIRFQQLDEVAPAATDLIAALASIGAQDSARAAEAFARGTNRLGMGKAGAPTFASRESGLKALDRALDQLALAAPAIKQKTLEACSACIGADGEVTIDEGELLRVIAASLDCPLPPLLAQESN